MRGVFLRDEDVGEVVDPAVVCDGAFEGDQAHAAPEGEAAGADFGAVVAQEPELVGGVEGEEVLAHASLAGAAGDRARGGHVGGGQVVGALEFLGEPGRQWHGGPYGAERCVGAGVGGGSGRDDVAAVGVDVDLPGEGAGGAGAGGALPAAGVGLVALLVSYESACNSAVRAPSSTGE